MHNSDRKINEKIKATIAVAIFIVAGVAFFALVFSPYQKVWSRNNHYDVLFLGASRVYKGIQPLIMDEKLGCNSYSLASDSCSVEDRYVLLESALEQGTLKTVVLEISYDALTDEYDTREDAYVFEVEPMSKLEGLKRKITFSLEKFDFWADEYDNVLPALTSYGFGRWEQLFRKKREEKGYVPFGPISKSITMDEAAGTKDVWELNTAYLDEKKECVNRIIETCLDNGIEVILINTPDCEAKLWQNTGWEKYHQYMLELSQKYQLKLYDFNLLKGRQIYFDDDVHFNDRSHLCENGATVFSELLADVIIREKTEDVSVLFYDTYDEAKEHSVYASSLK